MHEGNIRISESSGQKAGVLKSLQTHACDDFTPLRLKNDFERAGQRNISCRALKSMRNRYFHSEAFAKGNLEVFNCSGKLHESSSLRVSAAAVQFAPVAAETDQCITRMHSDTWAGEDGYRKSKFQ